MSSLRIRLCAVNSIDMNSLRSMLELSDKRLNSKWSVTHSGRVDLYLYSIETEEGLALFQQHKQGVSAVLSSQPQPGIPTALHIKKPLRSKQLADTLNAAEEKIAFAKQAAKVASIPKAPPTAKVNPTKQSTPKINRSLISSLSKHIAKMKAPAADLPPLEIDFIDEFNPQLDSLLDPTSLAAWIDDLPLDNNKVLLGALIDKLIPLNRIDIPANTRLALLECYRKPVNDLIFSRNVDTVKLEISEPSAFEAEIKRLNLFLGELTLGYKTVLMSAYQQGHRPNTDDVFLFSIIRSAELLSLSVIHAFRHYLMAPTDAIHDLHQLYIYCEANQVLNKKVSLKIASTKKAFIHFYNQLMLTGIADPYSLDKYDVFRLYRLMAKMADKVEISVLAPHHREAHSTAILSSYFCIDCTGDNMPTPLHHMTQAKRQLVETRMLNLHGVLLTIEQIFQAAASATGRVVFDLDIQLLKRVIPQFNASYQRQFQRLASVPARPIRLAAGIAEIHRCLSDVESSFTTEWTTVSQGDGGMMVQCEKKQAGIHNNGDIMVIFEQDLPPRLATIRWLQTNNDSVVQIGLQLHPGTPAAVYFTPDSKTDISKALLLPKLEDINQAETVIVEKGVYSHRRVLRINNDEKIYTIVAQELLDNTLNYEQFSFMLKVSSH